MNKELPLGRWCILIGTGVKMAGCSVRAMSSEHGMAMRMNMGRDAMSC